MHKNSGTRKVKIGKVVIGGGSPIAVQSMAKTPTADAKATVRQIRELEKAGCEIIRVAVPDMAAAKSLKNIKKGINIPLVADIHFDHELALEAVRQGVDKIRINPGNIGLGPKVKEVVMAAKGAGIPIRIGINSGSLKPGAPKASLAENMAATAADYVKMFEDWDFRDIVVSLKASDVVSTVQAYSLVAEKIPYPLHLGITEAGPLISGIIKSSAGMGILLYKNIGDTLRVSLTADPVEEVKAAYQLLQSLNLRSRGIDIISCPTCARCKIDLIKIINDFDRTLSTNYQLLSTRYSSRPIKVALMGCEVNGPGEAKHADIGVAGGKNTGLLFKHGKAVKKIPPGEWVTQLIKELEKL